MYNNSGNLTNAEDLIRMIDQNKADPRLVEILETMLNVLRNHERAIQELEN